MKMLITILVIFLMFPAEKARGQVSKIKIVVSILPELQNLLRGEEIKVSVDSRKDSLQTRVLDTVMGESHVFVLDNVKGDYLNIGMICFLTKRKWESLFALFQEIELSERDSVTTIKIQFPKDCAFNRHAADNTCPVCGKKDKVIPILYGLISASFDKKGRFIKPSSEKIHPGGCNKSDCDPNWYCKRDQLEF